MMHYFDWVQKNDKWLVYVVLSIFGLAILVFIIIILYRVNYIFIDRKRNKFRSTLISLLSKTLNHPEKSDKYLSRLRKLLTRKWKYEMLLDQLIIMCYSFQGIYAERARHIFDEFNLIERSKNKLKSNRWDEVVEGIMELSVIAEEDGLKLIAPLLDHSHPHVRREAKIAMVEIGKINGLIEMNSKMGVMSQWTYISILSILHRSAFKLSDKNLKILSESKNPSMRKLSAHLGKYSVAYN